MNENPYRTSPVVSDAERIKVRMSREAVAFGEFLASEDLKPSQILRRVRSLENEGLTLDWKWSKPGDPHRPFDESQFVWLRLLPKTVSGEDGPEAMNIRLGERKAAMLQILQPYERYWRSPFIGTSSIFDERILEKKIKNLPKNLFSRSEFPDEELVKSLERALTGAWIRRGKFSSLLKQARDLVGLRRVEYSALDLRRQEIKRQLVIWSILMTADSKIPEENAMVMKIKADLDGQVRIFKQTEKELRSALSSRFEALVETLPVIG